MDNLEIMHKKKTKNQKKKGLTWLSLMTYTLDNVHNAGKEREKLNNVLVWEISYQVYSSWSHY